MNHLYVAESNTCSSINNDYYHTLLLLRDDLRCQPQDMIALRLLLTRICSTFATCLHADQPMSLQILLKTEFAKLQNTYQQLDSAVNPAERQKIVHTFLESVDDVLVILEQRYMEVSVN
ncbi:hypothetical protein [Filimonas lacunae]|nr:hypothetical protein [Filimonas lacunae]